jgi:hypothetical protein
VLGIVVRSDHAHALVFHGAGISIEGFQAILHSFVENFAERAGVIFRREPDLQLWARSRGAHGREFYHEGAGQPVLAAPE